MLAQLALRPRSPPTLARMTLPARIALVCAFAFSAVLPATLSAQCTDPRPPRAGFKPKFVQDEIVKFSDGYKTYANVLYPDTAPGKCGWPLLVLIHGLSGSRKTPSVEAYALATQGFFIVAYDVRAQGDARTLTGNKGGSQLWALDEWIDLAEIIEWAPKKFPGLVDSKRVAVFGDSQGAVHAWAAAAYSERKLPTNTRRSLPFPKISCVVPRFFPPDTVDAFVPGGTSILRHLPAFAYDFNHPIAELDLNYRIKIAGFLDKNDISGLETFMRSVPGKDYLAELKQTKVPILAVAGWQDNWADPRGIFELFDQLPKATPRRVYLTTGTHGMPFNFNQNVRTILLTESWLKRHLKNESDPIEKGAPYNLSVMPSSSLEYSNQASLWPFRMNRAWPPKSGKVTRYYLRKGKALSTQAAAASEGSTTIKQTVSSGYNVRGYFVDGGKLSKVLTKIPLVDTQFTSAPFAGDAEFACNPKLKLDVVPNAKAFMLGAQIIAVSSTAGERVLASGAQAVRDATPSKSMMVTVELSPLATVVRKGERLRVRIRNLDLQKPDNVEVLRRIPVFAPFSVAMRHEGSTQSWLELCKLPRVTPDIASLSTTIDLAAPGAQRFEVRSSHEWKNAFYVLLAGFSGQGPPQILPNGDPVWIVPDPITVAFAGSVNGPMLTNFGGILNSSGKATATMNLGMIGKLPQDVYGVYMTIVPTFFTFDRGVEAGAPIRLRLR